MSARRRYLIAFFALGWLIAIGTAFDSGVMSFVRRGFDGVAASGEELAQRLSNVEGDAAASARGSSRNDRLQTSWPNAHDRAWLARPDRTLWGIYDGRLPASFGGVTEAEQKLGSEFPIVSIYQAWGDGPDEQRFPRRIVETIDRLGSVPMITWEPWVKDFDPALRPNLPPMPDREYASLVAIARGDYDFYITAWAVDAAAHGKPIFLRFAHEMNDPYRYPWGPQNGNRPDDFIAAWKHVHLVFQKMNASNVLWVWSPHISMPWFEYYYPGDEWVDWVGTAVLNYGDSARWSHWWTFEQIFGKSYAALEKTGKPVMITELGTLTRGGDAEQWYADAFHDIATRYPAIRSIVLFNQESDVTLSAEPLNWSPLQSAGTMRVVRGRLTESSR